jgi:hypothetical protein
MTFGLVLAQEKDPANPGKAKRLTFDPKGRSNNTCYRLDGKEFLLGYQGGQWQAPDGGKAAKSARQGRSSVWLHKDVPLAIVQDVEIVRGSQSGQPDTCLVRYVLENRDTVAHQVGLRFLLDTFVGARDGVPFAVPGLAQLCDTSCDRQGADVPDFLQALEKDDLKSPGTVAHLTLQLGLRLEAPARVTLGAWPDDKFMGQAKANLTGWDVPLLSLKEPADSAVTLYWLEKELPPKGRRELGFAYGLGTLAADGGAGRLAVAVGGSFLPGGDFTVAAYVKDPVAGETLTLELPKGLTLTAGDKTVTVPALPPGASPPLALVRWRVRSDAAAQTSYPVRVSSSAGPAQARTVIVRADPKLE